MQGQQAEQQKDLISITLDRLELLAPVKAHLPQAQLDLLQLILEAMRSVRLLVAMGQLSMVCYYQHPSFPNLLEASAYHLTVFHSWAVGLSCEMHFHFD